MLNRLRFAQVGIRAALSSLVGFGFLIAGLMQSGGGRESSDLVFFLLLFGLGQLGAIWLVRRARNEAESERIDALIEQRREELREEEERTTGPIVGQMCAGCGERIGLGEDAVRCRQCKYPVHVDCRPKHEIGEHATDGAYR